MSKTVFAIAAHPDDIEFMMSGTMFMLKELGCELHYMNIANGDCGTAVYDRPEIARLRRGEAIEAAKYMGAHFHESITSDLEIFYNKETLAKMISVIREAAPDILLAQYPFDYMEDHCCASRLAVNAAFCRGMLNAPTDPPQEPINKEMAVYYAMPYALYDPMRQLVKADMYVDVSSVMDSKKEMLAMHKSQKDWLDASQGMDSYLIEMERQAAQCGEISGKFSHAEGWLRRLSLGFGAEDYNPLADLLKDHIVINEKKDK